MKTKNTEQKAPAKTRKRRLLSIALLLFPLPLMAAEGGGKEWIDTSVLFMIDAFAGNTTYYLMCALKIARLMLLLMLLWDFIQMVLGTMEGRKVFIGGVTKWLFFLFILHVYPGFSYGLRRLAIDVGTGASRTSIAGLTKALGEYLDELESLLSASKSNDVAQYSAKIQGAQSQFDKYKKEYDALETAYHSAINQGYVRNMLAQNEREREVLELKMKEATDNIENLKKEQRNMILDNDYGASRTLLALRQVLIRNDKSITQKYRLDMGLKTASGQDTGLLSPNAMFRIGALAAQIMWEREWTVIDADIEKNREEASFLFKNSTIANFPVKRIFDLVLVLAAMLGLLIVMAVCLIQYIMALIEYTITSSFAIVLIPCMLFDPMKDMAHKILPTLLAQAVKLVFVTMAMFFCCWAFLQLSANISEQASGFDLNTFGYVIFTGLLCAAFCVFAPKWAQTLLTGQPQMSMGEFVAATGAAVAGAVKGAHMASGAVGAAKGAAQKGSAAAVNGIGSLAAMGGAGSAAKQAAAADGKGKLGQALAGMKGAAREGGSRLIGGLKEKANNFVRGGAKGGGGGLSGHGGGDKDSRADKTMPESSKEDPSATSRANNNSRDFARNRDENGNKRGVMDFLKAQTQAGRNNQNARLKKKKPPLPTVTT